MKIQCCYVASCVVILLILGLLPRVGDAQEKRAEDKYSCPEPGFAAQCNADNTCGSPSTPCIVNVRRTGYSASATPSIPNAKDNATFCVTTGTTVTWHSSAKNTGFLVDFGPSSPFDPPDTITGGSKKAVSVKAVRTGCFRYAFQATKSSAIKGMSEASRAELIVLGGE
jgi:hypothetical protein